MKCVRGRPPRRPPTTTAAAAPLHARALAWPAHEAKQRRNTPPQRRSGAKTSRPPRWLIAGPLCGLPRTQGDLARWASDTTGLFVCVCATDTPVPPSRRRRRKRRRRRRQHTTPAPPFKKSPSRLCPRSQRHIQSIAQSCYRSKKPHATHTAACATPWLPPDH